MYNYASVSSGVGIDVATDTVSGYAVQIIKLDLGGDGLSVPAQGTAGSGLLVDVARIQGGVTLSGTGNVFVTNFPSSFQVSNFPSTQVVSGQVSVFQSTNPWIVSGTIGQAGTWNVNATQSGSWSATVTGNVTVSNFPSSQTVTGTVNIGNLPATQVVSGTVTANQGGTWNTTVTGNVTVSNFPVSQVVTGTVNVGNFPATQAVTQSGAWAISASAYQLGTWTVQPGNTANTTPWLFSINHAGNTATVTAASALKVDNSGVTQPITGNVTVSNLPATQTVTGTVNIGNFPATQTVSGTVTVTQNAIEVPYYVAQGEDTWYCVHRELKGTFTTLLGAEMNSLTNGSITNLGSAFDNSSAGYRYGDFELLVTYGSNPTAGTQVELYLVTAYDGTNYSDGTSAIVSVNSYVGGFVLRATTAAQRIILRDVTLPQSLFKIHVKNSSGQSMAASGNTIKLLPVLGNR